jgi:hypothetical protein
LLIDISMTASGGEFPGPSRQNISYEIGCRQTSIRVITVEGGATPMSPRVDIPRRTGQQTLIFTSDEIRWSA